MMRLHRPNLTQDQQSTSAIASTHQTRVARASRRSTRLTLRDYRHIDLRTSKQEKRLSTMTGRERWQAVKANRTELLDRCHQQFPVLNENHYRQAGLFALIDGLLRKAEVQLYLKEKADFSGVTADEINPVATDSQKLLQMINRLLRENSRICRRIRISQRSGQSAAEFGAVMVGNAEQVLRCPLSHHSSVQQSAKALLNAFCKLKQVVGENPADVDSTYYLHFCSCWKRFTYLLFKERAYRLVQVDTAEIHALMDTTSRLSA